MDRENRRSVAPAKPGAAGAVAVAPEREVEAPPSTVLVTGASGFVGSAIAAALRARGHDVRVLARASSPRTNLDPADTLCEGDLRDRASLAARAEGRPVPLSRGGRLPALGERSGRDPPQQCRGNAPRHGGGAQSRASSASSTRAASRRSSSRTAPPRRRTRPLAEDEAIGAYKRSKVAAERLVEAMIERDRLPAVIVNPSTPIGPRDVQADADRPHHRRGRVGPHAGLRRHRAQPRPCRRRRRRPPRRARARADRRALHPRRRERLARRHAGRHRPPGRAAAAARSSCRARCSIRSPMGPRCWRACAASSRSSRWTACEWRAITCSSTIPRRGASSAMSRGPIARVLPTRSPGFAPTGISNDRRRRPRSARVWAYLLFGRGWFWLCARARRFRRRGRQRAGRLAERRRDHPGARRGRHDRPQRRLAPSRRTIRGASPWSWSTTRARTARPPSRRPRRARLTAPTGCRSSPEPARRRAGPASCGRCARASPRSRRRGRAGIRPVHRRRHRLCAARALAVWSRSPAAKGSVLTSLMVKLRCESAAERWLAPAFVFFFQMLYPFAWVNDPRRRDRRGGRRLHAGQARGASRGGRSRGGARRADRRLRARRAHERAGADLARPDRGASTACAPIRPSPISAGWWRARPSPNCAIRRCGSPARSRAWRSSISRRRCSRSSRGAAAQAAGALAWAMMALAFAPIAAPLRTAARRRPRPAGDRRGLCRLHLRFRATILAGARRLLERPDPGADAGDGARMTTVAEALSGKGHRGREFSRRLVAPERAAARPDPRLLSLRARGRRRRRSPDAVAGRRSSRSSTISTRR